MSSAPVLAPGADCFSRREPLSAYLERTEFVSSSVLRRIARSGVVTEAEFRPVPVPKEATLGDALHALLLEPDRFSEAYFEAAPGDTRARLEGTEALMQRTWLSTSACSALRAMERAILAYPRAPVAEWLASGEKELSIYWADADGQRWKARPDCLTRDVIVELKTAADIRPAAFAKSRKRFGYDLQAVHYIEAVRRLTGRTVHYVYLAVEAVRPYSAWVYELLPEEADRARTELGELKAQLASAGGVLLA